MAVLTGMRGYFAVHRICIFLVMSEAESPLMCLLATCEPLYRNVCWGLSRFFHVRWLGVLLYSYRHALCILDTNPLPNTQFTNSIPFPRLIFTVSPFTVNHLGWYNLTWFFNYLWFDVVCVCMCEIIDIWPMSCLFLLCFLLPLLQRQVFIWSIYFMYLLFLQLSLVLWEFGMMYFDHVYLFIW